MEINVMKNIFKFNRAIQLFLLFTIISFSGIVAQKEVPSKNAVVTENTLGKWVTQGEKFLNRQAVSLNGDKMEEFPSANRGFLWDSDDSKTKKFRPQGIAGLKDGGKEYICVSWYGRKEEGSKLQVVEDDIDYRKRGARISIVELSSLKYRHILLVDKDKKTYYDKDADTSKDVHTGVMHAGGIAVLNGKLHVADSRSKPGVIRVFDFNKIKELPEAEAIHDYRFILMEEYNYKSPIKPSFIAYDKDLGKILIGTFAEEPSSSKPNLMAWYKAPENEKEATEFNSSIDKISVYRLPDKYKKIQGMAASKADNGKTILWLSTSFGADNRSNFYEMFIDINQTTPKSPEIISVSNSDSRKYPPGLEDAYLSEDNELWLLTEFAFEEGKYEKIGGKGNEPTRRTTFSIKKSKITPK
jgi:hypothetical protein